MQSQDEHIEKIVDRLRSVFPKERERIVVNELLSKWHNEKEGVITYVNEPDNTGFPKPMIIGILASDWPGLSDAVMGAVHERGWNIFYEEGFVLEVEGKELAIIIIVIKIADEEKLKKFLDERDEIVNNIRALSIGSIAKRLLISMEAKRLKIYTSVVDIIERSAEKELLKYLIGAEGEVFKFFSSRSKAYIEERKPEDLAEQIIKTYKIIQKVKRSKGQVEVWTKNIVTYKGELTGITVGFYASDISLKEILDAIMFVAPDTRIMYNKEFNTPEGITVARLEVTDSKGKAYGREEKRKIRTILKRLYRKRQLEKLRIRDYAGGYEHYLRAIIPFLSKEFLATKIPQVYISIVSSSEYFTDFKVIIVTETGNELDKFVKFIEAHQGLSLLTIHPPKYFNECVVQIFDVRAEADYFEDVSSVYEEFRKILSEILGKFRDFDEGMRKMDLNRIQAIQKILKNIPSDELKELYYSIEDFYRLSETEENISVLLKMAYEIINKYKGERLIFEYRHIESGTFVVIAYSKSLKILQKTVEAAEKYQLTFSRLERPDFFVLLLKLSKDGGPLTDEELNNLLSILNTG